MNYPKTIKDLNKIYNKQHRQPGDTEKDFYTWAINYLLIGLRSLLNTSMNAHGETLETILYEREKLEGEK